MKDFFSTPATQPCAETTVTLYDLTGKGVAQQEISSADFIETRPGYSAKIVLHSPKDYLHTL
jgi:hypothetical protein